MCGISAIVSLHRSNGITSNDQSDRTDGSSNKEALTRQMQESLDTIKHRGPDSSGIWISDDEDIGPPILNT